MENASKFVGINHPKIPIQIIIPIMEEKSFEKTACLPSLSKERAVINPEIQQPTSISKFYGAETSKRVKEGIIEKGNQESIKQNLNSSNS